VKSNYFSSNFTKADSLALKTTSLANFSAMMTDFQSLNLQVKRNPLRLQTFKKDGKKTVRRVPK